MKSQRSAVSGMRRLIRRIFAVLMAIFITIWIAGFAVFLVQIGPIAAPEIATKANGIVVLAGGRGRIEAGMQALEEDKGERLLLSGVDPVLARETILSAFPGAEDKRECCVDLGRAALDTKGNAVEALAWARQYKYTSLLIVTADYHMPRAISEFRCRAGEIVINPMKVRTNASLALLFAEYSKYMIRLIRPCWL